jgi:ABC-type branched-subunit amino acid transport system substrate-binding protein
VNLFENNRLRMHTFQLVLTILLCLLLQLQVEARPVQASESDASEKIRIGLLLTENPENSPLMQEAADVAELAGELVNETGGIRQKQVQFVVKSVDGNWGAGSKQAVSLIYEHSTTALLGFVDGRSAHLIEQVCTKAEIPFISTLSPDPSLSRINIPWFFSTLPHADQQAAALAEHLYTGEGKRNIFIVTSDNYDQRFVSRSFADVALSNYQNQPATFVYEDGQYDFIEAASDIAERNADAIVFFGTSVELESLADQLTLANIDIPVYTPVMDLNVDLSERYPGPLYTLRPRNPIHQDTEAFKTRFLEKYGYMPGIQTTYLYNGLQILLRAIRENGEESDHIRESLANMSEPASFDSDGVLEQPLIVVKIDSETLNR